jgi:hypothetical protein
MRRSSGLTGFKPILLLAVAIALAVITACSPRQPAASPVPTYAPAVSYVNAVISDSTSGANVSFFIRASESFDTKLFNIVYYYDVAPPTNPGQPAYTAPSTYVQKVPGEESAIWKNVPAGKHTFSAQVVNSSDNTPFNPPIIVQSNITVPAADSKTPEIRVISAQLLLPTPTYVNATTQQKVPPLNVQITSLVHNIRLNDDNIGKQNVSGEGHLIYYLDVEPPTKPGQPAITGQGTFKATTEAFRLWENVPAGRRVFSVQLVNNDNTSFDPPVTAQIIITLPSKF